MNPADHDDRELNDDETGKGKSLLAALRALGATDVTIRYSGSGDSGCVDDVEVIRKLDGDPQENENLSELARQARVLVQERWSRFDHETRQWVNGHDLVEKDLHAALKDYCYDLLGRNFGGWEINEGSDGELHLEVATGEVLVEHNTNIMTQDTEYVREAL